MKGRSRKGTGALLGVFIGGLALPAANAATAPTVSTVYAFSSPQLAVVDSLVQAGDGNLYGTTSYGGDFNTGTLYQVTPQGSETVVHSFGGNASDYNGQVPLLVAHDGSLWGATTGAYDAPGEIFHVVNGSYQIVHTFNGSDGIWANALAEGADGNLYGVAQIVAGSAVYGAFRMTPAGQVTELYTFAAGASPFQLLPGRDGSLYGLAANGDGVTTTSLSFFKLTLQGQYAGLATITQNAQWIDALALGPDGNFYGVSGGLGTGTHGTGVITRLTPEGAVSVVHDFPADTKWTVDRYFGPNRGGAAPWGPLTVGSDGKLYGVTYTGGPDSGGTFFRMSVNGRFQVLYNFQLRQMTAPTAPQGAIVQGHDGSFYGIAGLGKTYAVYKIDAGLTAP